MPQSELISASLTDLSTKELAALELASSLSPKMNPCAKRLENCGFKNTDEYATALESARAHVKRYFAVRGVRGISDLDFVEPGQSAEGRTQKRVAGRPSK